jgi:hypothetical protein
MSQPGPEVDNRELRDELARVMGWRFEGPPKWRHRLWFKDDPLPGHPGDMEHHVPNTLDSAAACLPEGAWQCNDFWWFWFPPMSPVTKPGAQVRRTGDEIADRFALALAAMKAKEGKA